MYSCRDKKGESWWFSVLFFQGEKLGCGATVLPFSLSHSAVQHLKPTAHHTRGALEASQKKLNIWKAHSKWWIVSLIQITMASNEIENIYLWKITASSRYQSPFISTNSISFYQKNKVSDWGCSSTFQLRPINCTINISFRLLLFPTQNWDLPKEVYFHFSCDMNPWTKTIKVKILKDISLKKKKKNPEI